jgi:hypothetical protein
LLASVRQEAQQGLDHGFRVGLREVVRAAFDGDDCQVLDQAQEFPVVMNGKAGPLIAVTVRRYGAHPVLA